MIVIQQITVKLLQIFLTGAHSEKSNRSCKVNGAVLAKTTAVKKITEILLYISLTVTSPI